MQMHAGVREIYSRRVSSSVGCSLVHQIIVLFVYLADFSTLIHPFSWFKTCLSTLLSLKLLAFLIFMTLVTFLQVILFTKRLTRSPPLCLTRLKAVIQAFSVDNALLFLLNGVTGFAIGYMYVNFAKSNDGYDHDYLFKLLSAAFTGCYFFAHNSLNSVSFIQLPPLSGLPVKSQIRQNIAACIEGSLGPVLRSLVYFNIMYYLCGSTLGNFVLKLTGASDKVLQPLTILHMLSVWRLLSTYILCFFVFHILSSMKAITTVKLSCSWQFPISSSQEGHILLSEALSQNTMPSVQQLASQDLVRVAESDPLRRSELYILSQPGGHPRTWQGILKPFFTLVDNMCVDLSLIPVVETVKPVPPPEDVYFPISPTLRSLSPRPPPKIAPQDAPTCNAMSSNAKTWFQEQINLLLKKPPIAFVFGERTEAKIARTLIIQGQTLSNLVCAFSTIAQASFTEDSYGVVQQDLPSIISALLKLKSALDKLGNTLRKQNKSHLFIHLNIKSALRESIIQGIYRIVITFKDNLDSLNLSPEVKIQLNSFIQFKES